MKAFFQQLYVIFLALLAGQLLFAGVVYYLVSNNMMDSQPMEDAIFKNLVPILIIAGAGAAYWFNRQRGQSGQAVETLAAREQHYRSSVIVRSALMEGANFFAIIAALITQNLVFLLYFAVGLLAFIYFRPSKDEFINQYDLTQEEIERMDRDD